MDIFSVFQEIGNVAGIPAMLLVFYLFIRVRDIEARLKEGDADMKEMLKLITEIRIDVAVLRENKTKTEQET